MTRYMRWLKPSRLDFGGDYLALWRWSVDEARGFLGLDLGLLRGPGVDALVGSSVSWMPGAKWFHRRSAVHELLLAGKPDDRLAVQRLRAAGARRRHVGRAAGRSPARPRPRARRCARRPGRRLSPNIPETLVAFLATASIGAIWSSCSPDFGPGSVIDRFAQIEPKVLVCVDGYRYNGRDFDRRDVVADLLAAMPSSTTRSSSLPRPRPGRRGVSEPDRLERAARGRQAGRDRLRAGRLRPSALGPVLVRDHRPAG